MRKKYLCTYTVLRVIDLSQNIKNAKPHTIKITQVTSHSVLDPQFVMIVFHQRWMFPWGRHGYHPPLTLHTTPPPHWNSTTWPLQPPPIRPPPFPPPDGSPYLQVTRHDMIGSKKYRVFFICFYIFWTLSYHDESVSRYFVYHGIHTLMTGYMKGYRFFECV